MNKYQQFLHNVNKLAMKTWDPPFSLPCPFSPGDHVVRYTKRILPFPISINDLCARHIRKTVNEKTHDWVQFTMQEEGGVVYWNIYHDGMIWDTSGNIIDMDFHGMHLSPPQDFARLNAYFCSPCNPIHIHPEDSSSLSELSVSWSTVMTRYVLRCGSSLNYNILDFNCECFVFFLRYGEHYSKQAEQFWKEIIHVLSSTFSPELITVLSSLLLM